MIVQLLATRVPALERRDLRPAASGEPASNGFDEASLSFPARKNKQHQSEQSERNLPRADASDARKNGRKRDHHRNA